MLAFQANITLHCIGSTLRIKNTKNTNILWVETNKIENIHEHAFEPAFTVVFNATFGLTIYRINITMLNFIIYNALPRQMTRFILSVDIMSI